MPQQQTKTKQNYEIDINNERESFFFGPKKKKHTCFEHRKPLREGKTEGIHRRRGSHLRRRTNAVVLL